VALPAVSSAQNSTSAVQAGVLHDSALVDGTSKRVPTLKQVTVVGQSAALLNGSSELSGDSLHQLPKKNSSLTETVTILPRVQIGEGQRTSENAGEILPPRISISGGRAYENYFSLDGVGLNSIIDPLADNQNAIDRVPGHPQRTFVHQDLIDRVTVYDSNIPARFGRFTGGVVEARTRMPAMELGGNVSLRTTRDSWTQFHIEDENKDDFYDSNSFSQQPRFKKYDGGFEFDIPINEQLGFLGSYKRIQSRLELLEFEEWKNQDKTLETFFLKFAWAPSSPYTFEITSAYTPSKEDFFITDTKDSDFTVKRGGYSINSILNGDVQFGSFEATAAYIENKNTRDAPTNFYAWRNTPSKDWGEKIGLSRSREGGFGDIDNTEQSVQVHVDLALNAFKTGQASHLIKLGAEYIWDWGEYDREDTSYVHNSATLSSMVVCNPNDYACVDGEQYFASRNVYLTQAQRADINNFAAYLENLIKLGPVEMRPGVRVSHDDFMDNTNIAHRFASNWDVIQNGQTVLVGGYNRYYSEALLTYKLREAILPYAKDTRSLDSNTNELSAWTYDGNASITLDKGSKLDTPYSDEWTIGIAQQFLGGTLELNYLERQNKDQFAREKIAETVDGENKFFYILNNNGSSKYKSVKAAWVRQWRDHYLNINYTYSDQDSSNESYDDLFDVEDLDEEVWYDGRLINKSDLPRLDYNRKHRLNIIYTGKFPLGFTFTNVTRYIGAYKSRDQLSISEKTAQNIPTTLTAYEEVGRPDYWVFDWRLDWEKSIYRNQNLIVSFEIDNVFGRTPPAGDSVDNFELGRQFWLGMTYNF
jgi:hypothetical protein